MISTFDFYLRERGKDGAPGRILLDFDATDDPTHADQEGSRYHGYYRRQHMYHPLLIFDGESGQLISALFLRAGNNTHGIHWTVAILKRIVARLRQRWSEEVAIEEIRADAAGFAVVPAVYDYCEAEGITEGIIYTVVGLITNSRLLEEIAENLLEEARERHDEDEQKKVRLFSSEDL